MPECLRSEVRQFFLNFTVLLVLSIVVFMEASFFTSVYVPLVEKSLSLPQVLLASVARFGILEGSLAAAAWCGQGAVTVAFPYMMFMAVACWLFICAAALDIFSVPSPAAQQCN